MKFVLRGDYTLQTQMDPVFWKKSLEDRFWFVKIDDESSLRISREDYAHDASLKGEFVRLVLASDWDEAEKARVISCGIRALSGEEVVL